MKKSIVFIAVCVALAACHKKPQDLIVGKWKPETGSLDASLMIFTNNGTVSVQKGMDSTDIMLYGYKLSDDGKQILVYPPDKIPTTFKEDMDLHQELSEIVKLDDDSLVVKGDQDYHRFSRVH